ncbi:hypothetical protein [Paenibacillus sp. FSL R7-0026]|uniref:hypothetical protein n=1 Tax=Paenibacillus sp. FSL R7-0026 TaxID=2921668 RepID=UPI0030F73875
MTFFQLNPRDDELPEDVTSPSTSVYTIQQLKNFLSQNYSDFNAVLKKPAAALQPFSNNFTSNTSSTSTNPYVAICMFNWNTMTSKFGNPQSQRSIYLTSASAATITGWLPGPVDVFGNITFIHVSILTSDLASITCSQ